MNHNLWEKASHLMTGIMICAGLVMMLVISTPLVSGFQFNFPSQTLQSSRSLEIASCAPIEPQPSPTPKPKPKRTPQPKAQSTFLV